MPTDDDPADSQEGGHNEVALGLSDAEVAKLVRELIGELRIAHSYLGAESREEKLDAVSEALVSMAEFVNAIPAAKNAGLGAVLEVLLEDTGRVRNGANSLLIRPLPKGKGRPPPTDNELLFQGFAVAYLHLLMKGDRRKSEAAETAARHINATDPTWLGDQKPRKVSASQLISWRELCIGRLSEAERQSLRFEFFKDLIGPWERGEVAPSRLARQIFTKTTGHPPRAV